MPEAIRLVLADEETLLRQCLANVLNRRRGVRVVGEAETAEQAIELVLSTVPDVVVVSPGLPTAGTSLVADLCRLAPRCPVLVLTRGNDPGEASQALRDGARGYIAKSCDLNGLIRAIERVHAGELMVASVEASAVLYELSTERAREPETAALSARELEVVKLIARGWTNAAIARELCITEHTVKGHLGRILNKLNLQNRVQLATFATQQGFAGEPALTAT